MEGSPIFSRISTKLALMSGAGIFLMLAIIVGGWSIEHPVDEAITWRETQMGVSRDLVDAKASARGMQVAARGTAGRRRHSQRSTRLGGQISRSGLCAAGNREKQTTRRYHESSVKDYHGAAGRLQLVLATKSDAEVALIVGQMQKVADEMAPVIGLRRAPAEQTFHSA
ncbi:hypothetical protein [Sinorhizobium fredii]|uniref:hypothetical protein n=1 Tax=Rhizobium fredii TaxID=380 RepID=UPI001F33FC21|nr:hypothetical protein [Sinorhizobium fredii]